MTKRDRRKINTRVRREITTYEEKAALSGGEKLTRVILSEDTLWEITLSKKALMHAGMILSAMACGGFILSKDDRVILIADSIDHPFNDKYHIDEKDRPREESERAIKLELQENASILLQKKIRHSEVKINLEKAMLEEQTFLLEELEEGGMVSEKEKGMKTKLYQARIEMNKVVLDEAECELAGFKKLEAKALRGDSVEILLPRGAEED